MCQQNDDRCNMQLLPQAQKRQKAKASNVPAFFSSMESDLQSFFWISSSCLWTWNCSSDESRSHCASTLERGMAGWELLVLAEAAAVWDALAVAAMERVPEIGLRATRGRARRRACMVSDYV